MDHDSKTFALNRAQFLRGAGAAFLTAAVMPKRTSAAISMPPQAPPLKLEIIAEGLQFPEGPLACKDGSVLVTEVTGGVITRIRPNGKKEVFAKTGGGPNGLAFGPGGVVYCCNNGGFGAQVDLGDGVKGQSTIPVNYVGGSIQRIDAKGKVDVLYDSCDGRKLAGPNSLVFDTKGGFWFTDYGKPMGEHDLVGGVYYAKTDGSFIRRIAEGSHFNGIGLSPDGKTVYVSLTQERWVFKFDADPQQSVKNIYTTPIVADLPGRAMPDSLAIEADGTIALATVFDHAGITRINPATGELQFNETGDNLTTNITFGGKDLRTAYITLTGSGRVAKTMWQAPGLKPAFEG